MPRKQPDEFRPALCHPERQIYARQLCSECYDAARFTGRMKVDLSTHPHAEELRQILYLIPRADAKPKEKKLPRLDQPSMAKFAADLMIKAGLDAEKAAKELRPELTGEQRELLVEKLEHDPRVQRAIEQKLGIDDNSQKMFTALLWHYATSRDPNEQPLTLAAWRLLGRAMLPERSELADESRKVVELKIKGFEAGIARMTGDDAAQSEANPFAESTSHRSSAMDSDW